MMSCNKEEDEKRIRIKEHITPIKLDEHQRYPISGLIKTLFFLEDIETSLIT